LDSIKDLNHTLKNSINYYDREAAIWLGLALKQKPFNLDMEDLLVEFQEIELLLYDMFQKVNEASKEELSGWLNYLVNAAYSLRIDNT
jgi:hypothetical protein